MNRNLHLIKGDLKIIGRDPMLILCLVAPFLIMAVAIFLLPIISALTTRYFHFPIDAWFAVARLFLFPLTPMMFGLIYGFILLDERDGGIISYIAITPMGKSGYLKIRMLIPVFISFILGIVYLVVAGFVPLIGWPVIILLSIIVAFEAPMMLLFLAAFADNKVEGIAISKGFGIIMIPMLIDYFLKGSWRWAMAVSPLWWVERVVFCPANIRWVYLIGAMLVHLLFIGWLYRKFDQKMR